MEEIQCCLLGFDSSSLRFTHAAQGSSCHHSSQQQQQHEGSPSASVSLQLRDSLHATEVELLQSAVSLGAAYEYLLRAASDVAVGRIRGSLYTAAVGSATADILGEYAEAVKSLSTPSALRQLSATYELTFQLLVRLVRLQEQQQQQRSPHRKAILESIDRFLSNREVLAAFRQKLGEAVSLALLYTIAHYVAHGVVLHDRNDFFISVSAATSPSTKGSYASSSGAAGEDAKSTTETSNDVKREEHLLHKDLLPAGISVDVGLLIVAAGRERRLLLREAATYGSDYLQQLALGAQDEAADAVFHAIFNPSLCQGGVLAVDDLVARVEAAKALWSKALWLKVGQTAALRDSLESLQSMYMCHRGDVWFAFVEHTFDTALAVSGTAAAASGGEDRPGWSPPSRAVRLATLQRTVSNAFTHALAISRLAEREPFMLFETVVSPGADASAWMGETEPRVISIEDTAGRTLDTVTSISLRYSPPPGLQLIVSRKALQYYDRVFAFHMSLRFSLHALNTTRMLFSAAIVSNDTPSSELRRAYALYHRLHFMQTSLGYYLQVDVMEVHSAALMTKIAGCTSVEEAKRLHDRFIWHVAEDMFLTEGSETLLGACRALLQCSLSLYVLCTRYRLNYWAVEGANATPIEVSATLAALEARVQQNVVSVFTGHLSSSSRPAERALWVRLDFNRFFSLQARRAAATNTSGRTISGGLTSAPSQAFTSAVAAAAKELSGAPFSSRRASLVVGSPSAVTKSGVTTTIGPRGGGVEGQGTRTSSPSTVPSRRASVSTHYVGASTQQQITAVPSVIPSQSGRPHMTAAAGRTRGPTTTSGFPGGGTASEVLPQDGHYQQRGGQNQHGHVQ